jgi:hypothetical protein
VLRDVWSAGGDGLLLMLLEIWNGGGGSLNGGDENLLMNEEVWMGRWVVSGCIGLLVLRIGSSVLGSPLWNGLGMVCLVLRIDSWKIDGIQLPARRGSGQHRCW